MSSSSQMYRGSVVHERLGPTPHAFSYPATFFGFNLSEVGELSKQASLFGYNEFRTLSILDRDYLDGSNIPIEGRLNQLIPCKEATHTLAITSPRYLGYAFNPVNFHLRMKDEKLLAAVAEVNNTFGDRHVYPLPKLKQVSTHAWTASCRKDFHVSPFNNLSGEYHFSFRIEADEIFLGVDLHREGECILKTWIEGTSRPLTNVNIWRYALLHPFDTALNSMPRILWQAAQLYYKKRLKVFTRPGPKSVQTLVDRDTPQREQIIV